MRFKSVNCLFAPRIRHDLLLVSLALVSGGLTTCPAALATVTVEADEPYEINSSDTVYYSADSVFSGLLDEDAEFRNFDLSVGQLTDSSGDEQLTFTVTSDKTFSDSDSSKKLIITVFATTQNGGDLVAVPIATVGGSACNATRCQHEVEVGSGGDTYYLSARSTTSSTAVTNVTVGIYPKDICTLAYAQSASRPAIGCTNDAIDQPTATTPTTLTLTFAVGLSDDTDSSLDPDEATEKSDEITVSLHATAPAFSCPSMDGVYTPGDGEIELSTAFEDAGSSANAPLDKLIVVGADGADPVTTDSTFISNAIFKRLDIDSGTQSVSGFSNTTDGTDHAYRLRFAVRDVSGRLSAFATDASCILDAVQTSDIQGVLDESKCFIATATYRSGNHPAVLLLREFRDRVLLSSSLGARFVEIYYRYSPDAARWLIQNPKWRWPVMAALTPIIGFAWLFLHPGVYLVVLAAGFLLLRSGSRSARARGLSILPLLVASVMLSSCATSAVQDQQVAQEEDGVAKDARAPYLAKVRKQLNEEESSSGRSSLEQEKEKLLKDEPEVRGSYIEAVRKKLEKEEGDSVQLEGGDYIIQERKRLLETETEMDAESLSGSTITDTKKGVGPKRGIKEGDIHHGMGFKFGASIDRTVSVASTIGSGVAFSTLYAAQVAPDLTLSYEFQPFHSENFGSLGFGGVLGASLYRGTGKFQVDLPGFGSESDTEFRFLFVPVMALVNYRFNLPRLVRPYVQAAAGPNLFVETRSDSTRNKHGYSLGAILTGGIAINLNYLSWNRGWESYAEAGIHHTLLTIDYSKQVHLRGDLNVQASGINVGLNYEF